MMKVREKQAFLLITAVILLSFAFFYYCYEKDNKYTRPRPYSRDGVIWLEDQWYSRHPMFYLTDGWSFYQDKLLSPDEIENHTPDAYFYIGRYGGFDLGDREASPHGKGTYRTVILTEGHEQEYGLELTPVYSRWRLWVNGKLKQSVGMDGNINGDMGPRPPVSMVTFTAKDRIEIVVEAEDDSHFYSGMVYPPAFGVPQLVSRTSELRLLIHGAAIMAAFLIGAMCLCLGAVRRFSRPYGAMAFLCFCFCGSTAWPLFQVMSESMYWVLLAERFCYYGMFFSMMWIQWQICGLPGRVYVPACAAGFLICLSVLIQPLIPAETAGALYTYGNILGLYKWFTAFWLLATSGWAVCKKRSCCLAVLAGNSVFMCALVAGKMFPLHEPVLTGWFAELAGGVIILITGGIMIYDVDRTYKESLRLKMEQQLSQVQLEARARYGALQQEYIRGTRKQLHETRNRLTLIKHYLDTGETDKLKEYLKGLVSSTVDMENGEYTGHILMDSILAVELGTARSQGIYVEAEGDRLPGSLAVNDAHLTALLMNLLDNAIEACSRLPEDGEKWISLEIGRGGTGLTILCTNSSLPREEGRSTSKEDSRAHGYGMELMSQVVREYRGTFETTWYTDSFSARIFLPDAVKDGEL